MRDSYAIAAFDFTTAARQTRRNRMGLGDIGGGGWPFSIVVPLAGEIRSKPTGIDFTRVNSTRFRLTGFGTDLAGRIHAHVAPSYAPLRSV